MPRELGVSLRIKKSPKNGGLRGLIQGVAGRATHRPAIINRCIGTDTGVCPYESLISFISASNSRFILSASAVSPSHSPVSDSTDFFSA